MFGGFSNSYLIVDETPRDSVTVAMVDVGLPSDVLAAQRFLEAEFSGRRVVVKLIVLTHIHLDHVAGAILASSLFQAPVGVGVRSKEVLQSRHGVKAPNLGGWLFRLFPIWLKQGCPIPAAYDFLASWYAGFPLIRVEKTPRIQYWFLDGEELPGWTDWIVYHTPGHTDDGICLFHKEERMLFVGDLVLNFTGRGEVDPKSASDVTMQQTLGRLRLLRPRVLFPGHGSMLVGEGLMERVAFRSQLRCRRRRSD